MLFIYYTIFRCDYDFNVLFTQLEVVFVTRNELLSTVSYIIIMMIIIILMANHHDHKRWSIPLFGCFHVGAPSFARV